MKSIIKIFFSIIFLSAVAVTRAQNYSFAIGGAIGFGELKGNSPAISSMNFKLYVDAATPLSEVVNFRLAYDYGRKIEYFFPEDRSGRYYPFVQAFSLSATAKNYLSDYIFSEVSAGALVLNDRTYDDVDLWILGLGFSFEAGLDLKSGNKGFEVGLLLDYGGTYSSTNAMFYSVSLAAKLFL